MMLKLSDSLKQAILSHAAAFPNREICGFLLAHNGETVYHPSMNVALAPRHQFEISPDEWLKYSDSVVAVVHSHPNGEPYLSGADRQAQLATAVPWVLVVRKGLRVFRPVPHLRGREFVYGKSDCYSLIADAYHLAGIELMAVERSDMDADAAQGLFERFAPEAGFARVSADDLRAGDVVLTAHGSNANHAMLYLGGGEILHHAYGQLSRREPYSDYWQQRTASVWRHRDWFEGNITAINNDLIHSQ
ncbi:C40 family peptidase [Conchiformibius steedae]|uniref:Alkaline phosphatase n=1 Tax=Conchiformibius steedae TaxID=153493 RepID=A0A3P2A4Q5_9NEIS|nr:C40 family peptidase [Conchiformibius steedae]RRD90437.1 alkaline phosphatase [Conchiformibius steedae]